VGFVVGKVALGQDFSEYFGFPCQSSFHQLLHNHPHLSSGAGNIGQKWPQYKGLSPTPLAIDNPNGFPQTGERHGFETIHATEAYKRGKCMQRKAASVGGDNTRTQEKVLTDVGILAMLTERLSWLYSVPLV
jgi:hypothetical protein